jgi:peptidoglycan/xylan/chitin deacetylase (PgdA/CDA1 family)
MREKVDTIQADRRKATKAVKEPRNTSSERMNIPNQSHNPIDSPTVDNGDLFKKLVKLGEFGSSPKYRSLENFQYPEGIRMAVNFTVDFDAQLVRRLKNEPRMELTQGEFGGRVGIWRIMDLFDRYDIKLTIFAPGRIAELYPDSLKEAAKRGHELANHMWEHRLPADFELEKDHLRKATTAIEGICGKKPLGTRSAHSFSLLKEEGYIYVSDLKCAEDIPHYLYDDKQNILINLPAHLAMDDAMYFMFGWFGGGNAGQHLADPNQVYHMWLTTFGHFYKAGGYLNVIMHPFVSGRSLLIAMIEKLIFEMKQLPGVWFTTCEELAKYCIRQFPPPKLSN